MLYCTCMQSMMLGRGRWRRRRGGSGVLAVLIRAAAAEFICDPHMELLLICGLQIKLDDVYPMEGEEIIGLSDKYLRTGMPFSG